MDDINDTVDDIHIIEQSSWTPLTLRWVHILTLILKIMIKILDLKLVIMWEYQNISIFNGNVYTLNLSKKVFVIKKLKILYCGHI